MKVSQILKPNSRIIIWKCFPVVVVVVFAFESEYINSGGGNEITLLIQRKKKNIVRIVLK